MKPLTIFHIFNFTSDVQNKSHHLSPNSHWTITAAALPRINHIRKHEKNITWTSRYHTRNPYPHTTKITRDREDDGTMETI